MFPWQPSIKIFNSPRYAACWLSLVLWGSACIQFMLPAKVWAGDITFYNTLPTNPLLMGDGVTSLTSAFKFELGTFRPNLNLTEFNPSIGNLSEWTTQWKPFSRAEDPGLSGWNSAISYFNKSANLQLNGQSDQGLSADVFAAGEHVYLWVYNAFSITPGSEWALLTNDSTDLDPNDNWLMPDPTEPNWEFVLSNAYKPIIGGVHNSQGGGDFTAPLTAFTLQTHAVPEPSGALLIMLIGIAWRIQRARNSTL